MSNKADLSRLLAEERRLLLSGNLAALPALAPRREEALREIQQGVAPRGPALAALRRDLAANQILLAAAAKGIRAALDRVEAIRAVAGGLRAYNAQGESVRHGQAPNVMERRA
ncbi:MAG TPA: hypothetical protein PK450_01155 [Paracoccaceae bacterium]|nr:hypothetical protein [Paracoccaceae bacterium]